MRQRSVWSVGVWPVSDWSLRWRAAFSVCCWCALLLISPLVRASDFVEAQQEVPDSRHQAVVPVDPAALARRSDMKVAAIAHADCVRAAIESGKDLKAVCTTTRIAYATFLPQDYASLEISILERKVQQLAAPTKP